LLLFPFDALERKAFVLTLRDWVNIFVKISDSAALSASLRGNTHLAKELEPDLYGGIAAR
jgi:hypothetical protein